MTVMFSRSGTVDARLWAWLDLEQRVVDGDDSAGEDILILTVPYFSCFILDWSLNCESCS